MTPAERDMEWQRLVANDLTEIARLRTYLESANANVMEGARLLEQMSAEAADARKAAEWLHGEREKLIGTCCTLFDAVAFGIGSIQLEPNLAATEAGKALKAVLQEARFVTQGYTYIEPPRLDDLEKVLENPIIAGMLAAWSIREG